MQQILQPAHARREDGDQSYCFNLDIDACQETQERHFQKSCVKMSSPPEVKNLDTYLQSSSFTVLRIFADAGDGACYKDK